MRIIDTLDYTVDFAGTTPKTFIPMASLFPHWLNGRWFRESNLGGKRGIGDGSDWLRLILDTGDVWVLSTPDDQTVGEIVLAKVFQSDGPDKLICVEAVLKSAPLFLHTRSRLETEFIQDSTDLAMLFPISII